MNRGGETLRSPLLMVRNCSTGDSSELVRIPHSVFSEKLQSMGMQTRVCGAEFAVETMESIIPALYRSETTTGIKFHRIELTR